MTKVWNLGNTTIRNPNRIEQGLRLFANEFQGQVHGPEAETLFARRLSEEGIVQTTGKNGAWLGRKWRSVFVKLGFATEKEYRLGEKKVSSKILAKARPDLNLKGLKYELTPVGRRLIEASASESATAIEDVFLRQLVRHEISSPIEPSFPSGQMKPFIFLLQVLYELRARHQTGLTKEEIGVFLQSFSDHTDNLIEQTVEGVLGFRKKFKTGQGRTARQRLIQEALQRASANKGVQSDTLMDYADTTARYSQMSGLLTWEGSHVVLRENKINLIEAILAAEPRFLASRDPYSYLADYYTGTELPFDNAVFALDEIQLLDKQLAQYPGNLAREPIKVSSTTPIQELEQVRYRLSERLINARENEFAINQANPDSIKEILGYLEVLADSRKAKQKGIVDPPAFLEWAVWRGFLAIDSITIPVNETRRFQIDQDLRPRNPASSGGADMLFEFEDYKLVVEVTLTSSSRQEAAEGEPVRRHLADAKGKTTRPIYGLFIAPSIDNNTAHTFGRGVWYNQDKQERLDILPLTLNQFCQLLGVLPVRKYDPKQLRELIDRCLFHREAEAPEWKRKISEEVNQWVEQFH